MGLLLLSEGTKKIELMQKVINVKENIVGKIDSSWNFEKQ